MAITANLMRDRLDADVLVSFAGQAFAKTDDPEGPDVQGPRGA